MKKTFVLLWYALIGCTIVPDDSFESPPDASLKRILFTANERGELPTSSLTGDVSHSGNKSTIEFSGTLDPFWFYPKVDKIEYEFNTQDLLIGVVLTFEGGGIQSEEFSYNSSGKLSHATTSYTNKDGTDVLYEHDFFYKDIEKEVNGKIQTVTELDSIAKKVTLVNGSTSVYRGFFKRHVNDMNDDFSQKFYSIFPYTEADAIWPPSSFGCGAFVSSEDANKSIHHIASVSPFNFFEYSSIVEKDGHLAGETALMAYSYTSFPYIAKAKSISYDSRNLTQECQKFLHGPSYYRLLPEMKFDYSILEMLSVAEERYWVNAEPERMTPFLDLRIDFEYHYAE